MNNIQKLIELTETHSILWKKEELTIRSYHIYYETQYTYEQLVIRGARWFVDGYYCEYAPKELINAIKDQINRTLSNKNNIYYTNIIQANIDATINRIPF
jgi:hypothetical protein